MHLNRTTRIVLAGAAALGIAAGAAGIAGAATGASNADHEDGEPHDTYTSSITVDDSTEAASEDAESAALAQLATASADDASAAAVAEVPGDAATPELENEDGNVVYSVEVTAADGTVTDVKVDAGNAHVLATENETDDGPEGADGD